MQGVDDQGELPSECGRERLRRGFGYRHVSCAHVSHDVPALVLALLAAWYPAPASTLMRRGPVAKRNRLAKRYLFGVSTNL